MRQPSVFLPALALLACLSLVGCIRPGAHIGIGTGGIGGGISLETTGFPDGSGTGGSTAGGGQRPGPVFASPQACLQALRQTDLHWTALGPVPGNGACGIENGVRIEGSGGLRYNTAVTVDCEMAWRLHLFEKKLLQPASMHHFGQPMQSMGIMSGYSCRQVRGSGKVSQHGYGKAIDIGSFTLADGRVVALPGHWNSGNQPAAFLRDLKQNSCRLFSVSLGPEANADHRDHFHFDVGEEGWCR